MQMAEDLEATIVVNNGCNNTVCPYYTELYRSKIKYVLILYYSGQVYYEQWRFGERSEKWEENK